MPRILVIEDSADIRTLIAGMLKPLGFEVREAEDGVQGLQAYREAPADLVLLDMFMPEKDGLETLRELRQLDPGARVVAMTGGGTRNNVNILKSARLLGASALLLKPFTTAQLRAVVTETLAAANDRNAHGVTGPGSAPEQHRGAAGAQSGPTPSSHRMPRP